MDQNDQPRDGVEKDSKPADKSITPAVKFHIGNHAQGSLVERQIPVWVVREVLENSEQIVPGNVPGKTVYQKRFGKKSLVRVVVVDGTDPLEVATAYRTTAIGRYWVGPLPDEAKTDES